MEDENKLIAGFWHDKVFDPPLNRKPSAQAFINSLEKWISELQDFEEALFFIQMNAGTLFSARTPLTIPGASWNVRSSAFYSQSRAKFETLKGVPKEEFENICDRLLIKLYVYISNLDSQAGEQTILTPERSTDHLVAQLTAHVHSANETTRRMVKDIVSENEVETYYTALFKAARTYNWTPPREVIESVMPLATQLREKIDVGIAPVSQNAIFMLYGISCGLLAYATLDNDQRNLAGDFVRLSLHMAKTAGSNNLIAWGYGTSSLIQRFEGDHMLALKSAKLGLATATMGPLRSRLLSAAAESAANLGREQDVISYLEQSEDAFTQIPTMETFDLPGIFDFPEVKIPYYAGSSLVELGSSKGYAERAAEQSQKAISSFGDDSPDRSYPDQLVAQVHLARARLKTEDLDAVVVALEPLLISPKDQRTAWHRKYLRTIAHSANKPPYLGSSLSAEIARIVGEYERSWPGS